MVKRTVTGEHGDAVYAGLSAGSSKGKSLPTSNECQFTAHPKEKTKIGIILLKEVQRCQENNPRQLRSRAQLTALWYYERQSVSIKLTLSNSRTFPSIPRIFPLPRPLQKKKIQKMRLSRLFPFNLVSSSFIMIEGSSNGTGSY